MPWHGLKLLMMVLMVIMFAMDGCTGAAAIISPFLYSSLPLVIVVVLAWPRTPLIREGRL